MNIDLRSILLDIHVITILLPLSPKLPWMLDKLEIVN